MSSHCKLSTFLKFGTHFFDSLNLHLLTKLYENVVFHGEKSIFFFAMNDKITPIFSRCCDTWVSLEKKHFLLFEAAVRQNFASESYSFQLNLETIYMSLVSICR